MVKLKATTKTAAMHYLEEVVHDAKYDMNCYKENTPEYEKEKDRYYCLNALLLPMENIAADKTL